MSENASVIRSDSELIADIRSGEHSAFDVLYARHREWVYRLALRFTGNDADAWDVLQETFVYLAGKAPSLVLTASLRTLLFPAIRNLAMKANSRRRRLVSGDELLAALPAASAVPADQAMGKDDLREVLQAMDGKLRMVIILRYIDDLSIEEMAGVLGIPRGTVKSRLFHAHREMRENARLRRYFQP